MLDGVSYLLEHPAPPLAASDAVGPTSGAGTGALAGLCTAAIALRPLPSGCGGGGGISGKAVSNTSWLRLDDEAALQFAASPLGGSCGGGLHTLVLVGIDMSGLTRVGLEAVEGMAALQVLTLSKLP